VQAGKAGEARSPPGAEQVGLERHSTPDPDRRQAIGADACRHAGMYQRKSGSIRRWIGDERHAGRRIVGMHDPQVPADQWSRNDHGLLFDNRAGGDAVAVPTAIRVQGVAHIASGCNDMRRGHCRLAGIVVKGHAVDLHRRQQDDHDPSHDHEMASEQAQQDVPGTGHEASDGETVDRWDPYRVVFAGKQHRMDPGSGGWAIGHDEGRFRSAPMDAAGQAGSNRRQPDWLPYRAYDDRSIRLLFHAHCALTIAMIAYYLNL